VKKRAFTPSLVLSLPSLPSLSLPPLSPSSSLSLPLYSLSPSLFDTVTFLGCREELCTFIPPPLPVALFCVKLELNTATDSVFSTYIPPPLSEITFQYIYILIFIYFKFIYFNIYIYI
jgi:hypothetical protein